MRPRGSRLATAPSTAVVDVNHNLHVNQQQHVPLRLWRALKYETELSFYICLTEADSKQPHVLNSVYD